MHFLKNRLRKLPGILLDDVSLASSELSRLWSQFVDFLIICTILTSWNGSNLGILAMLCGFSSLWCPFDWNWSCLGFLGIIWRTCGSKCRGGEEAYFRRLALSSVQFNSKHSKMLIFTIYFCSFYLAHHILASTGCEIYEGFCLFYFISDMKVVPGEKVCCF